MLISEISGAHVLWTIRIAKASCLENFLIGVHYIHVASLSEYATGPEYTFHSGTSFTFTTVNYIFIDIEASSCIEQCWTHADEDMHLSDHLPISAEFSCNVVTQAKHDPE